MELTEELRNIQHHNCADEMQKGNLKCSNRCAQGTKQIVMLGLRKVESNFPQTPITGRNPRMLLFVDISEASEPESGCIPSPMLS